MKAIYFYLFIAVSLAYSSGINCKFGNLFVSSSAVDPQMVVATYFQILNEVGHGQLSSAEFNTMIKNGDPFRLPSERKISSETLQDSLSQFEELLKLHSEDSSQLKEAIISALREHVAKSIKSDKKLERIHLPEYKLITEIIWPERLKNVYQMGQWYLGATSAEGGGKVYFHNGKEMLQASYSPPGSENTLRKFKVVGFNRLTGEMYFSEWSDKFPLRKAKVFDAFGKPLQSLVLEEVNLELASEKLWDGKYNGIAIESIEFSQDGNKAVFRGPNEGIYFINLNEQKKKFFSGKQYYKANKVASPLGFVLEDDHYGFLGNGHFYTNDKSEINIYALDKENHLIKNKKLGSYYSKRTIPSLDGKSIGFIFSSHENKEDERPFFGRWDWQKDETTSIQSHELGHPKTIIRHDNPIDHIADIPNTDYVLQLYFSNLFEDNGTRLYVISKDFKNRWLIYESYKSTISTDIQKFSVSLGHDKLYLTTLVRSNPTKTWIFDIKEILDRKELD